MADTTRGAPRIRSWPRKRGKKPTKVQRDNQNKFMNAQRSTKYFAHQMYQFFMAQVEDSPLLPRDAMTMMLYNRLYAFTLNSGRTLWPMPAYFDVSDSLDVITNQPGQTIVRGPNGWQPVLSPGPSGMALWRVVMDTVITDPVPEVICTQIKNYNEVLFFINGVTAASSGTRIMQMSTNDGASFYEGSGDYSYLSESGSALNRAWANLHGSSSSGARYSVASIKNLSGGVPAIIKADSYNGFVSVLAASLDPVNAIRFKNSNSADLTGGQIIVMAR